MILKGEVSSYENNKFKVYFPDIDYVSDLLEVANHISGLNVKDTVIVAFYDSSMSEGAIIAKI